MKIFSKKSLIFTILMLCFVTSVISGCSQVNEPAASAPQTPAPEIKPDTSEQTKGQVIPTMSKHQERGAQCLDCHVVEDDVYLFPTTDSCLQCHGSYEEVAAKTISMEDYIKMAENPHDSHIGQVNCSLCHKDHQESENYCNECHMPDIQFNVP